MRITAKQEAVNLGEESVGHEASTHAQLGNC